MVKQIPLIQRWAFTKSCRIALKSCRIACFFVPYLYHKLSKWWAFVKNVCRETWIQSGTRVPTISLLIQSEGTAINAFPMHITHKARKLHTLVQARFHELFAFWQPGRNLERRCIFRTYALSLSTKDFFSCYSFTCKVPLTSQEKLKKEKCAILSL